MADVVKYCTADDIERAWGLKQLLRISSIEGDVQALDYERIDQNIELASDIINSYLSYRYDLPLANVPGSIKADCIDIAVYKLCPTANHMTKIIEDRYKDAMSHLDMIAKGKAGLGMIMDSSQSESSEENPDHVRNTSFFSVDLRRR